jgi:anti-sigma B factor antagonist
MPIGEAAPALTLDVEREGEVAVVRCHGRLVAGVNNILYAKVCQLMPESKRIVLDLGDLAYMDSTGVGTLVRIYASSKGAGVSLELLHLGKRVRELLSLANLLSVFTVIGEQGTMIRF